jgi:hypothetical protein
VFGINYVIFQLTINYVIGTTMTDPHFRCNFINTDSWVVPGMLIDLLWILSSIVSFPLANTDKCHTELSFFCKFYQLLHPMNTKFKSQITVLLWGTVSNTASILSMSQYYHYPKDKQNT